MKNYSDVNGRECDMVKYNQLLKKMALLAQELLDVAPVEQFGQVERAEVIQELVAASRTEYDEDLAVIYTTTAAA